MRQITEANAKVIAEALQEHKNVLQELPKKGFRLQNKIRLIQIALTDLRTNKFNKNERIKSK